MKTKKTTPYSSVRQAKLANPEVAAAYLNEAHDESQEAFLRALFTVAQARQMTKVAKDAGVQRETLYRSLSEQGNPTLFTFDSVLSALGIGYEFFALCKDAARTPPTPKADVGIESVEFSQEPAQTFGIVSQSVQGTAALAHFGGTSWCCFASTVAAYANPGKTTINPSLLSSLDSNGVIGARETCQTS